MGGGVDGSALVSAALARSCHVEEPPKVNQHKCTNRHRKGNSGLIRTSDGNLGSPSGTPDESHINLDRTSNNSHEGEPRDYNTSHLIHHRVLQRNLKIITNQLQN